MDTPDGLEATSCYLDRTEFVYGDADSRYSLVQSFLLAAYPILVFPE